MYLGHAPTSLRFLGHSTHAGGQACPPAAAKPLLSLAGITHPTTLCYNATDCLLPPELREHCHWLLVLSQIMRNVAAPALQVTFKTQRKFFSHLALCEVYKASRCPRPAAALTAASTERKKAKKLAALALRAVRCVLSTTLERPGVQRKRSLQFSMLFPQPLFFRFASSAELRAACVLCQVSVRVARQHQWQLRRVRRHGARQQQVIGALASLPRFASVATSYGSLCATEGRCGASAPLCVPEIDV